jgi:hypothetical protein
VRPRHCALRTLVLSTSARRLKSPARVGTTHRKQIGGSKQARPRWVARYADVVPDLGQILENDQHEYAPRSAAGALSRLGKKAAPALPGWAGGNGRAQDGDHNGPGRGRAAAHNRLVRPRGTRGRLAWDSRSHPHVQGRGMVPGGGRSGFPSAPAGSGVPVAGQVNEVSAVLTTWLGPAAATTGPEPAGQAHPSERIASDRGSESPILPRRGLILARRLSFVTPEPSAEPRPIITQEWEMPADRSESPDTPDLWARKSASWHPFP